MSKYKVLASALALSLAGCATPMTEKVSGYLCCNQSNWKGWIYRENMRGGAVVPFGEPVVVNSIQRGRYAYGTIGESSFGFGSGSGNKDAETIAWLRMIAVKDDPRKQFETWPTTTRAAVSSGKVLIGMSREQVLMSLGHPAPDVTPKIEAMSWKYWTVADDDPVELVFGPNGTLEKVLGKPSAINLVELKL